MAPVHKGGPQYGRAPDEGLIDAKRVAREFLVAIRSFVETNWVGTAIPMSPNKRL